PRKTSDGVLHYLVGVFFLSLPFVMSFTGWEKFRVPKGIYAALFILLIGTVFLVSRKLELRFRPWTWEFFLGIALVYVALHSLLGRWPEVSLSGFVWITYFAALLLVLTEIASEQFQKKLWMWIGAAAAVNAVFTILQYFGWFPLMIRATGEVLKGRLTPAGFIGDVGSGGFLFALVCLILLYPMLAEKDKRIRIASALLFSLNLAGLAFTRTLTAIIALVVCLGIWLVFHHWWVLRTTRKITRQLLFFWMVLLLGVIVAVGAVMTSGVQERIEVVWSQMKQGDWTLATAGRQPVYLITWDMIRHRFWLGYGLNTFRQDFFFHRVDTPFGQSVNLIGQPGTFGEVHNEYLQVWEELGFLGLLFFVAFLFWPAIKAVPLLFRTQDSRRCYWIGILSIGLVFVAISCLAFFPFHLSLTSACVVLLLAGLRHFQNEERTRPEQSRQRMLWKVFIFSALALWAAYPQVGRWRANNEMGMAASLLRNAASEDSQPQQKRLFAQTAREKLRKAEQFYPGFYEIYYHQGYASLLLGKPEEAARYYRKAAGRLPSAEIFTDLAAAYMAQKRFDQARPLLEMALRYNPALERAREALAHLEANAQDETQ
ncbi:O-antigen ligase family protein, partial [Acidobacteria bacterium AH-259-O06]|nr:O-antigen ligase family protein [Acidobacteria bacterium AH-259-O06]